MGAHNKILQCVVFIGVMVIFVLSGCVTSSRNSNVKEVQNFDRVSTQASKGASSGIFRKIETKGSPPVFKRVNMWQDFIFGLIAGMLSSLLIQMYYEWSTQPKLVVKTDSNDPYRGSTATVNWCGYHLQVSNNPGGWLFRTRKPAWNTRATIEVLSIDGITRIIADPIQGRWARSPEPLIPVGSNLMVDIGRIFLGRQTDIFANDPQQLDVAVKYDNDRYCYIWSNESYLNGGMGGRRHQWELDQGTYRINVRIIYEIETIEMAFLLENLGLSRDSLRIERVS